MLTNNDKVIYIKWAVRKMEIQEAIYTFVYYLYIL